MRYYLFFLALFLCIAGRSVAQINEGGVPLSFNVDDIAEPQMFVLPKTDNDSLRLVHNKRNKENTEPFVFAQRFELDLPLNEWGEPVVSASGSKIYRICIVSKGAYSINITMSGFNIPDGANVFVYNKAKDYVLGAFSSINNTESGIFPIAPVPGDRIIVEYDAPAWSVEIPDLSITSLGHDFTNNFLFPTNDNLDLFRSESCEVNINCSDGDDWQVEKRAVVKLAINNSSVCTGVLINNTAEDGTPYLLSANHCYVTKDGVTTEQKVKNTVAIFNYESPTCNGNTGSYMQTISGTKLMSTTSKSTIDFVLLKLNTTPPATYRPYYAGWDITGDSHTNTVCIHHPDGDIKKISKDYDKTSAGNYGETYLYKSHWLINKWDVGATEPGSSGAPLFNSDHKVIGTLTGGRASCESPVTDYFSKISVAWDYYKESDQQLEAWLDPTGSGATKLSGFDPYSNSNQYDLNILEVVAPQDAYCNLEDIEPIIKVQNLGTETVTYMEVRYQINNQPFQTLEWTGTIPQNTTKILQLDKLKILEGENTIYFEVLNPNKKSDEKNDDNIVVKKFTAITGQMIDLKITTDKYGYETSWVITDMDENVLYAGSDYKNSVTITESFCLSPGCYTFKIFDSKGDGICCKSGNGSFKLTNRADGSEISEGFNFGAMHEANFCIDDDFEKQDLAIVKINAPNGQVCQTGNITPEIIIKNYGTDTVLNVSILYSLNNNNNYYNWSGELLQFEYDTIQFEEESLQAGTNSFFAKIETVNGSVDENSTNNQKQTTANYLNNRSIKMSLYTDICGDEVTWQILDADENVLYAGGPYRAGSMVYVTEYFCLEWGKCYYFLIDDRAGDGICCGRLGQGSVKVVSEKTNYVIYEGGDYGVGVKQYFCLTTAGIDDIFADDINLYPNPSNELLNIATNFENGFEWCIYDISGKIFQKGLSKTNIQQINTNAMAKGLYFLKISDERTAKTYMRKFVVGN